MGMNYYDPFLAAYLLGETTLASESLTVTGTFNQLLEGLRTVARTLSYSERR